MANIAVDSLFTVTKIPLHKASYIYTDTLYKNDENTAKIPKNIFHNLQPKNCFL